MKIKIVFLLFLFIFAGVCFTQIFNIFPFADDVKNVYESDYFKKLNEQAGIISDIFVSMKMMTKPEVLKGQGSVSGRSKTEPTYSWIMIDDLQKKYNIDIKVYDRNGKFVPFPYSHTKKDDQEVLNIISSGSGEVVGKITNGKYYTAVPLKTEKKCLICHRESVHSSLIGVITFSRDYDSYVFYGYERIIIFSLLLIIDFVLIFFVLRWDPQKNIKELFDKTD